MSLKHSTEKQSLKGGPQPGSEWYWVGLKLKVMKCGDVVLILRINVGEQEMKRRRRKVRAGDEERD